MGFLQTVLRHLSRILDKSQFLDIDDEENLDPVQLEFRKFLESLSYHPLLNHIVIQNIFLYCSTSDLLRFRLVCKSWHHIATSHLLLKDSLHRVVSQESDLHKLLSLCSKNSNSFPIQSFYIKIPSLGMSQMSTSLFKTLSLPCVVSLKIVIESKNFAQTVKTICGHMKTLKHLVIYRIPEQSFEALGTGGSMAFGVSGGSQLCRLPNLISLSLKNAKPRRNFLATYDQAVIELIKSAQGKLECLEFWHWGLLTRILKEGQFNGVRSFRVVGGKLSERDVLVLIGKRGLCLDKFSARVDKSVGKQLVNEFLNKRIRGGGKLSN